MLNARANPDNFNFQEIVALAPLPIYVFDLEGIVHLWNPEAERVFGWRADEVLGRPMRIIPPERAGEFDTFRQRMLSAGRMAPFETLRMRKDGSLLDVSIHPRLLLHDDGVPWAMLAIVKDISERKALERRQLEADQRLRESEERLRTLVERFPGLLWTCDRDLRLTSLEGGGVGARGLPREDLVGRTLRENGASDAVLVVVEQALLGISGTIRDEEYREGCFDSHVEPLRGPTGEVEGAIGVTIDVTEVKKARGEVQASREELQRLSGRILEVQEEQRTRISRELHDDLGQKLTALKYDVAHLQRTTSSSQTVTDQLKRMSALLDETLQAVRDIARELRPAVLDHFGVGAAMEYELREFEQRTGLRCTLTVDPPDVDLPPACATALYRISQEALTNVARHAQATVVDVVLRATDSEVAWTFCDNGAGLPPPGQRREGVGLASMRERVAALGGRFWAHSRPEGGTLLRVTLPLVRTHEQRDAP